MWNECNRLRRKAIDELRRKQNAPVKKIGGTLALLGQTFNKLTAQLDPELAVDDYIALDKEEEQTEEVLRVSFSVQIFFCLRAAYHTTGAIHHRATRKPLRGILVPVVDIFKFICPMNQKRAHTRE